MVILEAPHGLSSAPTPVPFARRKRSIRRHTSACTSGLPKKEVSMKKEKVVILVLPPSREKKWWDIELEI
jgi:hypothetical protein